MKKFLLLTFLCTYSMLITAQNLSVFFKESGTISIKNYLNYAIQNNGSALNNVFIKGRILFKNNSGSIDYLLQGQVPIGNSDVQKMFHVVSLQYSSKAVETLFMDERMVIEGAYEHCISIFENATSEGSPMLFDDCNAGEQSNDFLINLVSPDDDEKITDYFPNLVWQPNGDASKLTYRLRVTDIKDGQNAQNAIMRNRPMLDAKGIRSNNTVYPANAAPLQCWTFYAWTVDAYYQDILVGSAETWKFAIVDDSLVNAVPKELAYLEVNVEQGANLTIAPGILKLKYIEKKAKTNSLSLSILNEQKETIHQVKKKWAVTEGLNQTVFDIVAEKKLKHSTIYYLQLQANGQTYLIKFLYFNPEFL